MKNEKLSTAQTRGGGGALNSQKIAEKADKIGTFSDLNNSKNKEENTLNI
ncbi:MAG: hypothetical protein IJ301_03010 [Clostridia bacterium]|nr:hypothetical protein [Clostridia bacterium]